MSGSIKQVASAVLISAFFIGSASAGQDKVEVCHKPGTSEETTLNISPSALRAHLGHGDYEGACHAAVSSGCATLNTVQPDPQTNATNYLFVFSDLVFSPGETIHASLTITPSGTPPFVTTQAVVIGSAGILANDYQTFSEEGVPGGSSSDYVVGSEATLTAAVAAEAELGAFSLNSVKFSCTPANQ